MDELRALLAPLDAERTAVEREIAALGDQEGRLRKLDSLPALVEEYLRDLAYLVDGSGLPLREYETVPGERTEDNPLGIYTLTPESIRDLSEEKQIARRLEARNARSAKFRDLYETLGLGLVVHKDGTLEVSWSLGASVPVLLGVVPAFQTEVGRRLGRPQRKVSRTLASATNPSETNLEGAGRPLFVEWRIRTGSVATRIRR